MKLDNIELFLLYFIYLDYLFVGLKVSGKEKINESSFLFCTRMFEPFAVLWLRLYKREEGNPRKENVESRNINY